MTNTHIYAIIDQTTKKTVKERLIPVARKPSTTEAYYIHSGHYKVLTSNGESLCSGPVWILWDTAGFPYPITPEEFDMVYIRHPS